METGEERDLLSVPSRYLEGQLRWSPDGRFILCGGRPGNNLHLIDVQTGHVTANVATGKGGVIWGPAWSPDGKTIFYTRERHEKEDWPCRMVALNLETRKERVPVMQKMITDKAGVKGKPVITATQMLESMVENAGPPERRSRTLPTPYLTAPTQ